MKHVMVCSLCISFLEQFPYCPVIVFNLGTEIKPLPVEFSFIYTVLHSRPNY